MENKTLSDFENEINEEIQRINLLKRGMDNYCWLFSQLRINLFKREAQLQLCQKFREMIKKLKSNNTLSVYWTGYNDALEEILGKSQEDGGENAL